MNYILRKTSQDKKKLTPALLQEKCISIGKYSQKSKPNKKQEKEWKKKRTNNKTSKTEIEACVSVKQSTH